MQKYVNRYRRLSEAVKASMWFTICSMLQRALSLVTVPIFTRILTTEQYGQVSLFQSWHGLITIIGTFNLFMGGFNKGMQKYSEKRDEYVSSVQSCSTFITLLLFLIYLIFKSKVDAWVGLPPTLMWLLFLDVLFVPAFQFWAAKNRYEYKYKSLVAVTLSMSIVSAIVALLAVMTFEEKGIARICAYTLTSVAFGLVLYFENLLKGRKIFDKEYWMYAFGFNIPLIPHYLSGDILSQADRIMINSFVGQGEVALYSVAYTLGMLLTILNTSINNSFVPWEYDNLKNNNVGDIRRTSTALVLFIGGIVLLFIGLAPEAIKILASDKYASAIPVLPPVSLSVYFIFVYTLFANVEFYYENSKSVLLASISAAAINVILNAIIIPRFGFIGAGYTTLVSYILLCILHYSFMKKICKKNDRDVDMYDSMFILKYSFFLCICCILFNVFYKNVLIRYVCIMTICFIAYFRRENIKKILTLVKKK